MIRPMRMATMVVALTLLAAGCSGKKGATTPSSSGSGAVKKGGILRIGTTSAIDSLNPYNYIETQATNAMIMIYPQLVQYGPGMKFEEISACPIKSEILPNRPLAVERYVTSAVLMVRSVATAAAS